MSRVNRSKRNAWHPCPQQKALKLVKINMMTSNVVLSKQNKAFHHVMRSWSTPIFLTWTFLMTPLQSTETEQLIIVPQEARAQTNTLIQRYQKNQPKRIYSFLGSGPAIFPTSIIFSHASIVLLLKTFLWAMCTFNRVRQHRNYAWEGSTQPRLPASGA